MMSFPRSVPWLCAALLLTAGCVRLLPVVDPLHTVASDRYGTTQEVGPLTVTVRTVGWRNEPVDKLESYVTPLFLKLRNNGSDPVPFRITDVVMVDDEGTLYQPIPPQRLESLLTGTGAVLPSLPDDPTVLPPYDSNLAATLGALMDGTVAPGTQLRGAVYFQREVDWAREVIVQVTVEGQRGEFRFRVR